MRGRLYHDRRPRGAGAAGSGPTARPMHTTLPRHFYTDPQFYLAELDRFYFNRWICAGRIDQLPASGDFFVRTIGDESLIITRDATDDVHALFNVCRHRGT